MAPGRARAAQVYPPELVQAVLKAFKVQLVQDGSMNDIDAFAAGPIPEEHEDALFDQWCWDDVNGGYLDLKLVQLARAEELRWIKQRYTMVKVST